MIDGVNEIKSNRIHERFVRKVRNYYFPVGLVPDSIFQFHNFRYLGNFRMHFRNISDDYLQIRWLTFRFNYLFSPFPPHPDQFRSHPEAISELERYDKKKNTFSVLKSSGHFHETTWLRSPSNGGGHRGIPRPIASIAISLRAPKKRVREREKNI